MNMFKFSFFIGLMAAISFEASCKADYYQGSTNSDQAYVSGQYQSNPQYQNQPQYQSTPQYQSQPQYQPQYQSQPQYQYYAPPAPSYYPQYQGYPIYQGPVNPGQTEANDIYKYNQQHPPY